MCAGSVCTQAPYNDKDPPSGFYFFNLVKSFPLSHIQPFSDACLYDVTKTQAPSTIVDWHWRFTFYLALSELLQSAIVSPLEQI